MITKYEIGLPCMLGETVGRIVGEDESGSWGNLHDFKCFSVPLFATPHGTIIKTGVFHLSDITDEGMQKLLTYEADVISKKNEPYAGKLKNY